jgi:hypothetical protein
MDEDRRAAKAEALLALLESRICNLEKPRQQALEETAALRDTVARLEYRVNILVQALKEADEKQAATARKDG